MSAATRPTSGQVIAEIAALKALKDKVPARTAFGEDNREAVDAQIAVLEGAMSIDSVYNTYGWMAEDEEKDERTLDLALQAQRWLEGESGEAPSQGWERLVRK